jgi:TonB family protein
MADQPNERRVSVLSTSISLLLHTLIVGGLVFYAAREGLLGKQLRKIAVTIVPPKEQPEKPREELTEKPPDQAQVKAPDRISEPAPKEPPPRVETAKAQPSRAGQPGSPVAAASPLTPVAAPPAAEMPAFDFEGGQAVDATANPEALYRGFVEYTLRSNWKRPEGVSDLSYVAEVEVAIDPTGRIRGSEWKKGSGNSAWDDSVRKAVAQTKALGRPPPRGFPEKLLVRFDVQAETEVLRP